MNFKSNFMLDTMWLSKVSYKLEQFRRMSPTVHTYACRCVECGDSRSRANKLSLYFYTKKGSLNFECKRCGYSGSFWRFMKEQCSEDFEDYKKEYLMERVDSFRAPTKSSNSNVLPTQLKENKIESTPLKSTLRGVTPVLELPDSHKALKYLYNRGFEDTQIRSLLYSREFKVTAQQISPIELDEKFPNDERIVIPFYSVDGKTIEMIQGRSLDSKASLRYVSIKSNEEIDKVFGKNGINRKKTSYCVEGPFDSLFIDNCMAACDANLERSDADVLIWDNEPRSNNIIKYMERAIENGRSVVIWPISPNSKQDINDLILLGMTSEDLMNVIRERTYSGLMAKLKLSKWRKM